jgi:hypothetical protein
VLHCARARWGRTSPYYTHLTAIKVGSVSGALKHANQKALSPKLATLATK